MRLAFHVVLATGAPHRACGKFRPDPWAVAGEEFAPPRDKPLTLAAYESGEGLRTYVVGAAVGDALVDMPLFLQPGYGVFVPLEMTYNAAFAKMPQRRRRVLDRA